MFKNIILLLFLVTGIIVSTSAQQDPKAKTVLDAMSDKYQNQSGLKATFEFSYSDVADGRSQNQKGEIAVKGDMYHLKLPEQEIFNNGKTVWTYIQSGNYKEVTINDASAMDDELTPSSVYTIYKKGYTYRLVGERNEGGKTLQEIELLAEKSSAPFKRVKLFVDKNKKDLIGWEIYDDQGGVFKYAFQSVDTEVNLAADYFTFNPQKYGKVEIIDLR